MTSSGRFLWSSTWADRNPGLSTAPAKHCNLTKLSASPCGRWILIMDTDRLSSGRPFYTWQFTLLEASTGQILAKLLFQSSAYRTAGDWSMSRRVCLLATLRLVLVYSPGEGRTSKTFQQYKLLDTAASQPNFSCNDMSLSPRGRTVIGLRHGAPGLEH